MNITHVYAPKGSTVLVKVGPDQYGNQYVSSGTAHDGLVTDLNSAFPDSEVVIVTANIEDIIVIENPTAE